MIGRVEAADAARNLTLVERRIVGRQQEVARVLVVTIVRRRITDIRGREQAWHVGVVGKDRVPQPVDFVGVDVAVFRHKHQSIGLYAALDFIAQRGRLVCLDDIMIDRAFDLGHVAERDHGEHFRRNQEVVVARIIRRAEPRPNNINV